MKQGKPLITLVILILAATVAIYFAAYIYNALDDPYRTTQVYAYTSYDSVTVEGLVVREARVLPAQPGILEITRAEGEKVGTGQEIALVYRDSQAQANQVQIEELEMEIELLEYAIDQGGDLDSAARLDEDILQAVVGLRASYALGDCTQLRDQVMNVKSSVLKRGYTYGEGLTPADLTARLRQLKEELTVLTRQSARATTRVTAPEPGVFSSLVDGYESLLTPDTVLQLTPSALQELIDNPAGEESGALGKLLTSNTWYFAANLPKQSAERLTEGKTATLRFSGELNREVEMTVEQIGPTEQNKTLVVFSSSRYLILTTLLRCQTVELIFDRWSGLRIPKQALHLEEVTRTDDKTGEPVSVQILAVYALVNGHAELREVEIVHEGEDYYVVRSVGTGPKVLRAEDTIITEATGLQDGLRLEG
ncbi:MAG: hypothetical protein HFF47_03900 [Lawsonibacter sp.]|jgi:hypothetical protein|nr:hypothetical protein [Lawsonibacter sp.]